MNFLYGFIVGFFAGAVTIIGYACCAMPGRISDGEGE